MAEAPPIACDSKFVEIASQSVPCGDGCRQMISRSDGGSKHNFRDRENGVLAGVHGDRAIWPITFTLMGAQTTTEHFRSESESATAEIARNFAAALRPGDVVLLRGELGSGKTAFVRAAAAALGVASRVTSPTFAIGNVYTGDGVEVAHLDLYRLAEIETSDEAVVDDFLTRERIGFVEWPHAELVGDFSPRAIVSLSHAGGDAREIAVEWNEAADVG